MSESTGKRKSKRQYWQQVVSDWQQSDIKTQKEFFRQLGISTKLLSRWRRVTMIRSIGMLPVHLATEPVGVRKSINGFFLW